MYSIIEVEKRCFISLNYAIGNANVSYACDIFIQETERGDRAYHAKYCYVYLNLHDVDFCQNIFMEMYICNTKNNCHLDM